MRGEGVERSGAPMNKNRLSKAPSLAVQARNREAPVIKTRRCGCGGWAVKECVLAREDFALRPKERRALSRKREVKQAPQLSAGAKGRSGGGVLTIARECGTLRRKRALHLRIWFQRVVVPLRRFNGILPCP